MSLDWTLLLVVDAALLAGASLTLVALVLRDLRRERRAGGDGDRSQEKGDDVAPSSPVR